MNKLDMISEADAYAFHEILGELAQKIHDNNVAHGFWEGNPQDRNKGEAIALMHSELSEALEAIRKPKPDEHLPEHDPVALELADCVIRILDFAAVFCPTFGAALIAKHNYNCGRPFKHGKAF